MRTNEAFNKSRSCLIHFQLNTLHGFKLESVYLVLNYNRRRTESAEAGEQQQ